MARGVVDRIVWVGKGAVLLVGLAVTFALMFAGAIAAANAVLGSGDGTVLSIEPDGGGPPAQLAETDEADLGLAAEPVAVRRQIEFPRGYAQVNVTSATVTLSGSKGINGVRRSTTDNSVYCFDLAFAPRVAVASANINNNATVGTVLGGGVPSACPAGFKDAAARTYGANDSLPHSDINFGIVFI